MTQEHSTIISYTLPMIKFIGSFFYDIIFIARPLVWNEFLRPYDLYTVFAI